MLFGKISNFNAIHLFIFTTKWAKLVRRIARITWKRQWKTKSIKYSEICDWLTYGSSFRLFVKHGNQHEQCRKGCNSCHFILFYSERVSKRWRRIGTFIAASCLLRRICAACDSPRAGALQWLEGCVVLACRTSFPRRSTCIAELIGQIDSSIQSSGNCKVALLHRQPKPIKRSVKLFYSTLQSPPLRRSTMGRNSVLARSVQSSKKHSDCLCLWIVVPRNDAARDCSSQSH